LHIHFCLCKVGMKPFSGYKISNYLAKEIPQNEFAYLMLDVHIVVCFSSKDTLFNLATDLRILNETHRTAV
jgi:hypothetical protein